MIMKPFSKIWFTFFLLLFCGKASFAQKYGPIIRQLPDSLQPANPVALTAEETKKILAYSWLLHIDDTQSKLLLDQLCLDFLGYVNRIKAKPQRLDYLRVIYLHWKNKVPGNESIKRIYLDSARKYNDLYGKEIGADSAEYRLDMAHYNNHRGGLFKAAGQYSEAFACYLKSIDVYRSLDSYRYAMYVFQETTGMHMELLQFKQAKAYCDSAMWYANNETNINRKDPVYIYQKQAILMRKATIFCYQYLQDRSANAADSASALVTLFVKNGVNPGRSRSKRLNILIRLAYVSGDFERCAAYADSLLVEQSSSLEDSELLNSGVYRAMATYKLNGDAKEIDSIKVNSVSGNVADALYLLRELHQIAYDRGRFVDALSFQKRLVSYKDSIDQLNHAQRIFELKNKYEMQIKDVQLRSVQENFANNRLVFLLVFAVFSLVVFILAQKNIHKANKTKRMLAQIEELTLLQMYRIESEKQKERKRLGQDLHDNLAGLIAASVRILRNSAGKTENTEDKAVFTKLSDQLSDGYEQTRKHAYELFRQGSADDFWRSLSESIDILFSGTQIKSSFENHLSEAILSSEAKTVILLTLREAITNIVKHADATSVQILLYDDMTHIVLEIMDNGKGLQPSQGKSVGLDSIRDRVAGIGGTLVVESRQGHGVVVKASIPLADTGSPTTSKYPE